MRKRYHREKKLGYLAGLLLCLPLLTAALPPLVQPEEYPAERQVHQQRGGFGDIPVRGFYDDVAFPSPVIEARWGPGVLPAGSWTVIDPAPSGGVFGGVLPGQPVGWGQLEVRIQGGPTLYTIPDVGVGDVYVIAGQSNAVMTTETLRTSSEPSSVVMLDAPAAALAKWTADPLHDSTHVFFGSVWPPLADTISATTGMPVMFVSTAEGATGLVDTPDWTVGAWFWNRMLQNVSVATSGQNCVRAVLWFQGETDALRGVSYWDYRLAFQFFAATLQSVMACPTPVVTGVIGPFPGVPEANLEAIRDAQRDAATSIPYIVPGPEGWDLPTIDGLHYGDAAIPFLLSRWCAAVSPAYPTLLCPAEPFTACGDLADNDADGLTDLDDPGCDDIADTAETTPLLVCDDGLDNDGDNFIDAADSGCADPFDPSELIEPPCDDGLDNDADGLTDLADPGCSDAADESEKDLLCLPDLPLLADTYIEHDDSDNFGDSNKFRVGPDNDGLRGLVHFDASSIPSDKKIATAKLQLYMRDGKGGGSIEVAAHRMDEAWVEDEVNWESSDGSTAWSGGPGGTYRAAAAASESVDLQDKRWYEWELRSMVNQWSQGLSPNHGILLLSDENGDDKRAEFISRENTAAPRHPKLQVCVTALPCDDGIDNDGDGNIDLDDPQCASPSSPSESGFCGLGPGLVVLLPLLLRRRRRGAGPRRDSVGI